MDWIGWIGVGFAIGGNVAYLAYHSGVMKQRMEISEEKIKDMVIDIRDMKELKQEIAVVKTELRAIHATLDRMEKVMSSKVGVRDAL